MGVFLFCCCLPNCPSSCLFEHMRQGRRQLLLPICMAFHRDTKLRSTKVFPGTWCLKWLGGMNPMKPLVDWKRGFWNHGVFIYIHIYIHTVCMIMIMQQMIHIQFYTLVAWKFATSMGILISLLVGFLIMIPIMACDHPTLPIQTAFGSYPEVGSRWHSWHRKGSAVINGNNVTHWEWEYW